MTAIPDDTLKVVADQATAGASNGNDAIVTLDTSPWLGRTGERPFVAVVLKKPTVQVLALGCLVCEEFPVERHLEQVFPDYGHGAAVGFEEEDGPFQRVVWVRVTQGKDSVGDNADMAAVKVHRWHISCVDMAAKLSLKEVSVIW